MNVNDLLNQLNSKFDFNLAEDWDNVGLLIGDGQCEVRKVLTTLDIDIDICVEAVTRGCNVIVSHHPLFAFDHLKKIVLNQYNGALVKYILENNLNVIAMHTNVDNCDANMSRWIAEDLGFEVSSPYYTDGDKKLGVICNVDIKYGELLENVKQHYKHGINFIGDENFNVKKIAIIGGSGSDFLSTYNNDDVDVLMTGDLKYHDFHEMFKLNKFLIDIGHYAEIVFVKNILKDIDVEYCVTQRENIIKQK